MKERRKTMMTSKKETGWKLTISSHGTSDILDMIVL
jgi:hypothetical protein